MITALEPLGRDALAEDDFTALVRTITGHPEADPGDVRVEPVDYPIGTPSTEALRVFGTALLPTGAPETDTVDWSCFVKSCSRSGTGRSCCSLPSSSGRSSSRTCPGSSRSPSTAAGSPTCSPRACGCPNYRIDLYDDDRGTLWMENVTQEPGPWPLERFERAAYLLGRLSARRQPHLVQPLLPRGGDFNQPGYALRYYPERRVMMSAVPALADPETWRHPLLAAAVCHAGDHRLRDDLLDLAERLPVVLDASTPCRSATSTGMRGAEPAGSEGNRTSSW